MSEVKTLDDSNFDTEVTNASGAVLVKLGAEWCGPCKRQQDVLDKMLHSDKYKDIKFVSVDIDDAPLTAQKLAIRSVPSLLFYKEGKIAFQKIGLTTELELAAKIGESLLEK